MEGMNFISLLNRYFNYGHFGRLDKLIACVNSTVPLFLNKSKVSNSYEKLSPAEETFNTVDLHLPVYEGNHETIGRIGNHLKKYLRDDIAYAIIHGSIATNEDINYSDFDGLIILKDEVFKSRSRIIKTALHLNQTYKMMLTFDTYQHHGWIILCEKHLKNWPCSYFPPEILKYSKTFPGFKTNIQISFTEKNHYTKEAFDKYCNNFIRKLNKSGFPGNVFQIKSILSEFMLLPSLYIQTKTGTGVFKKNSFALASKDFTEDEWQIMEDVSAIRNEWPLFNKNVSNNKSFSPVTRMRQIYNDQELPKQLTNQFTSSMVTRMIKLTTRFNENINDTQVH